MPRKRSCRLNRRALIRLVTAELGAVAEPLEQAGPDVILLVRVDRENQALGMVIIPAGLQVATETARAAWATCPRKAMLRSFRRCRSSPRSTSPIL